MDSKLFWIRNKKEIITTAFVIPLFTCGLLVGGSWGGMLILSSMIVLFLYSVSK